MSAAAESPVPLRLGLLGSPNSGKTTLFNALTGLRARVGNYPGVTVERREGPLELGRPAVIVDDVQGLARGPHLRQVARVVVSVAIDLLRVLHHQ